MRASPCATAATPGPGRRRRHLAGLLGERGYHDRALDLLDEATDLYRAELDPDDLAVALAQIDQNRGLVHLAPPSRSMTT